MFMDQQVCADLTPLVALPSASPEIPLELRQLRRTLPCGTQILCVAIQAQHRDFTYAMVVQPGFEGGGRGADNSMLPRSISPDYTPKIYNPESQEKEPVWPALAPTVRLINGREYDGWQLPENALTRRLEQSYSQLEPLLRQLCNLLQSKLAKGRRKQVSYAVLAERIRAALARA